MRFVGVGLLASNLLGRTEGGWLGLDPELVGKLLQASVTGAGLTFAVYAFLLPRANPILERRADVREETRKGLLTKLKEGTEENIEDLARKFSELSKFPWILSGGILVTFLFYGFSSLLTWLWLFYRGLLQGSPLEWFVPNLFGIATALFIALGFFTIKETGTSLQQLWAFLKTQTHRRSITTRESGGSR